MERTLDIFQIIETVLAMPPVKSPAAPSSMTLRERKAVSPRIVPTSLPPYKGKQALPKAKKSDSKHPGAGEQAVEDVARDLQDLHLNVQDTSQDIDSLSKRLPRIILRIKEPETP